MKLKKHRKIAIVMGSQSDFSTMKDCAKILKSLKISFDLKIGETIGIVGESGSGKTSLILAILKLIRSRGEIIINKKNLNKLSKKEVLDLRKDIQVVFQDPFSSLSPRMNIEDIISEGLMVHYPNIGLVNKRKKLLDYLKKNKLESYKNVISKLNIRK